MTTLHEAYRRALLKQAIRETARMKRKAKGANAIEQVVWGRLLQDAYLECGWHPLSEEVDKAGFTKMTMRLDTE